MARSMSTGGNRCRDALIPPPLGYFGKLLYISDKHLGFGGDQLLVIIITHPCILVAV